MQCALGFSSPRSLSWAGSSTDQMFKRFRRSSYYPYGWLKGAGFFLALGGCICFLCGALATIFRWDPFFLPCWAPKESEDPYAEFTTDIDNEEIAPMAAVAPMAAAQQAPMSQGPPGPGDPSYDPMGPPPMGYDPMGPPPMGDPMGPPPMGDPMGPPPMGGGQGMGGPPPGGPMAASQDDLQDNTWG